MKEIVYLQYFGRYQPFFITLTVEDEKVAVTHLAIVITIPKNDQLFATEKVFG